VIGRFVDYSFVIGLLVLVFVGLAVLVYSLMGWTFVHDKLRAEQKQDEKENRKYG